MDEVHQGSEEEFCRRASIVAGRPEAPPARRTQMVDSGRLRGQNLDFLHQGARDGRKNGGGSSNEVEEDA